jgi:hypothetical protein
MSIIISKHQLNNIILEEIDYVLRHDSRFFLNETILYEGMLDSITAFVGNKVTDVKSAIQNSATNAQNFAIALKKIIENPNLIKQFLGSLNRRVINGYLIKLIPLITKLNIPNNPKAVQLFNFLNGKIQSLKAEIQKAISKGDWSSTFIVMSIAAILKFINDKLQDINSLPLQKAIDTFVDFFKKIGGAVAQKVLATITDIKTYFGWIGPLIGGIQFFLELIAPATKAVAQAVGNIVLEDLSEGTFDKEKSSGLHGWFQRQGGKGKSKGWVDCNTCRTDKKTGRKTCKSCGRQSGEKRGKYPACRPTPSACNRTGTSNKKDSVRVSWKKKKKD